MMLLFVGVVLALIKFKLSKEENKVITGFRIPGGITIPMIALVTLVWFLSHSRQDEIQGAAIFIAIVSVTYLLKILFGKREIIFDMPEAV
ncbi:MAG: hypothetical protein ABIO76_07785 [Ginsengibacter sp.]